MLKDFSKWFSYLDLYTRLLACTTVFISLCMSGLMCFILYGLYKNILISQLESVAVFSQVIVLYFKANWIHIKSIDLESLIEHIYLTIQDIGYIFIVDQSDSVMSVVPENFVNSQILSHILSNRLVNRYSLGTSDMYSSYILQLQDYVDINIIFRLPDLTNLTVHIGLKSSTSVLVTYSFQYTCFLSVLTFLTIWLVAGSIILINFMMINDYVQHIKLAVKRICSGDFTTRVSLQKPSGLIELCTDFNNMAKRLELYEDNNVKQLVLEKSKLETILSISNDGLILLDQELRIVFINPSASKNLIFLKSCIVGNYLCDYLPSYINQQIKPPLDRLIHTSSNVGCDMTDCTTCVTVSLANSNAKTLHIVMTAVFDIDKKILNGIGMSIQDMTAQVGLNEAKAQFISNVSHELRTPLFNIRSFLETLSEYHTSLSEQQKLEFLEIANQETQRLTYLVNDVLDLSRLESDFVDVLEPVEVHEIVPPIIQTSYLRANNKKVKLIFQISPNVPSIHGYPNLLMQVLSNLIGNAMKFTGVDGRILLKVYVINSSFVIENHKFSRVRIEIIDEGTGIEELDQSRIFDRFVRLENNVHTLEGTGLGLSIVKNIVEKHSSQVHLYSELFTGSSFWFDLPLLEKKS
uniref:Uncharacterized sensor-like histidine kinase ycf26 n=1 Tax=Neoizziella asiatica TaxID=1077397 RepID=A0A1G4NWQ4_9FLOR|nr:Drug sensory protein A [Neoizziella asiatica]SCW23121.1 Drug sensory protein A [Neoizziella asiatica]